MAYYNRPEFLRRTLQAYYNISKSIIKDCEFIIVDDKSSIDALAKPIANEFKDKLNITVFDRIDKDDINPAVAINLSVKLATSDTILITCPETMPGTSFIEHILNRDIKNNEYILVPCYSISQEIQNKINLIPLDDENYIKHILEIITINPISHKFAGGDGWYSHPIYRPALFYFCATLKRKYFLEMDGIDEDFRYGWGYEDTDFVRRLQLRNPTITWLDSELCLHQNHYTNNASRPNQVQVEGTIRNKKLYENKEKLKKWKVL